MPIPVKPIPKDLNCSEIPRALEKIEKEGLPPHRASTKFCLEHDLKHYAPKVVVRHTYLFQFGKELCHRIDAKAARKWLEKCGYQVILCPCKCGGHGTRPNR